DTIGALTDTDTVEVNGGKLEVSGAVSGTGGFTIDSGATLQFDVANTRPVTFAGSTGELIYKIAANTTTGNIMGLSGGDAIDFSNLNPLTAHVQSVSLAGGIT